MLPARPRVLLDTEALAEYQPQKRPRGNGDRDKSKVTSHPTPPSTQRGNGCCYQIGVPSHSGPPSLQVRMIVMPSHKIAPNPERAPAYGGPLQIHPPLSPSSVLPQPRPETPCGCILPRCDVIHPTGSSSVGSRWSLALPSPNVTLVLRGSRPWRFRRGGVM